jgi:hypothetical protein
MVSIAWRPRAAVACPGVAAHAEPAGPRVQVQQFFEQHGGPVAKLAVQRDCRQLVAHGQKLQTLKLAAERLVNQLLQVCPLCLKSIVLQALETSMHHAADAYERAKLEAAGSYRVLMDCAR